VMETLHLGSFRQQGDGVGSPAPDRHREVLLSRG
jgi:hypothetical protein